MALPSEVFLSHASADKKFATRLANTVRRHGVHVWYSPMHIRGSQQWHDEIGAALKRCDWFLVVMSPNAVKSKWVKREVRFALNQKRYEDRIIPVLLRTCDVEALSWVLPIYQRVDFRRRFKNGC